MQVLELLFRFTEIPLYLKSQSTLMSRIYAVLITGCLLLLNLPSIAQDSISFNNSISAGFFSGQEFFYHMEEGDKDGQYYYNEEFNYKLESKVYYLKLLHRIEEIRQEYGISAALSIGKVTNDATCMDSFHHDLPTCHASRNRYAFSAMYRRNWLLIDKKRLTIYGGAGAGLRITVFTNYESNDPTPTDDDIVRVFCPIAIEAVAGIRFFPLKYFGIYIEGGFAKSVVQGGIITRF